VHNGDSLDLNDAVPISNINVKDGLPGGPGPRIGERVINVAQRGVTVMGDGLSTL